MIRSHWYWFANMTEAHICKDKRNFLFRFQIVLEERNITHVFSEFKFLNKFYLVKDCFEEIGRKMIGVKSSRHLMLLQRKALYTILVPIFHWNFFWGHYDPGTLLGLRRTSMFLIIYAFFSKCTSHLFLHTCKSTFI